jgi:hypothetical protein
VILPRNRPLAAQAADLLRSDEQLQSAAVIVIRGDIAVGLRHKRLAAEAGETFVHIGRVADLARFAVANHIDADGDLAGDDIGDRLLHLRLKLSAVIFFVAILLDQHRH